LSKGWSSLNRVTPVVAHTDVNATDVS
jgi:hypothetical protein